MRFKNYESVESFLRENSFVCPLPIEWNEIYQLINEPQIGPPLILNSWHHTSDNDKKIRFLEHALHASRDKETMKKLSTYLENLNNENWLKEK